MAVEFRILKSHGLVYVRYDDVAIVEETFRVFGEYVQHPDFRPGQKQLVDLSGLTSVEHDFPKLFELQMRKAEAFVGRGTQTLLVYYAPTKMSLAMAQIAMRAWEGIDGVVPIVQQDEAQALALLGVRETCLNDLLAAVD
ncbi:MAG: hypothetical protein AAFQ99_09315 [Pseudomonadota bacterium]